MHIWWRWAGGRDGELSELLSHRNKLCELTYLSGFFSKLVMQADAQEACMASYSP